ncbi:hypothetical protein HPB47_000840 [Ixodes persulcatus]|uniref:Uncharacterized protein n=1 Tax=Ixodes persulcatus TaxID=34615 RepID=A0AC60PQM1_IXOPE|nr:hypothetical protein HPB47_000840 [Ixodes persulcatus]
MCPDTAFRKQSVAERLGKEYRPERWFETSAERPTRGASPIRGHPKVLHGGATDRARRPGRPGRPGQYLPPSAPRSQEVPGTATWFVWPERSARPVGYVSRAPRLEQPRPLVGERSCSTPPSFRGRTLAQRHGSDRPLPFT